MNTAEVVTFTEGELVYRDFAGKNPYSHEGDRTFCLTLSPVLANTLLESGWPVRSPRKGSDVKAHYIPIYLSPKVTEYVGVVTNGVEVPLSEPFLERLDDIHIKAFTMEVLPYAWTFANRSGVKVFLKSLVIITE